MIFIDVNGSSSIGLGHIVRMKSLASKLVKSGCEVVFLTNMNHSYLTESFEQRVLSDNERASIAKKNDCVIIDRYDIDQDYIDQYKLKGARVGYVDDLGARDFKTHFVINGNVYANRLKYHNSKKAFLGHRYLMLREEFYDGRVIQVNKRVKDILVTFGGSDPSCITMELIDLMKRLNGYTFHVIIGPHFSNRDIFKDSLNIIYYHNPSNIIDVMLKTDIAITASGSTMYELAMLGIPMINIIVAENQKLVAEEMATMKLSVNLGNIVDLDVIKSTIERIDSDYKTRIRMHQEATQMFTYQNQNDLVIELQKMMEEKHV